MPAFNTKELKVIDAAHGLFHRYGFKRVTMNDIAVAADMSRPALYLVFPNKEEIFEAVVRRHGAATLTRIRQGIALQKNVAEKLRFAFEEWAVAPFEVMQQSPDAREMLECTHGFARDALDVIRSEYESILREALTEVAVPRSRHLNAATLAHLLVACAQGFKNIAADSDELRNLIACQVAVLMKALDAPA